MAMKYRRKISGGIMGTIGYLLSPFSWWNDLYVNIPIAYVVAWLVSLFYKPMFMYTFIFTYWVTNVAGLILMHKGVSRVIEKDGENKPYTRAALLRDIVMSLLYTSVIVALAMFGIIRPVDEYLKKL